MESISILVVDDHYLIRHGIREVLASEPSFEVVGEAANFEEVQRILAEKKVDVVVLDVALPRVSGIQVADWIRQNHQSTKTIALSMYAEEEYILSMVRAGAKGYILKNTSSTELLRAIERVMQGGSYFSQEVSEIMLRQYTQTVAASNDIAQQLSPREREIIRLVAQDNTNQEMADHLKISIKTVESAKRELFRKLGVKNSMGLLRYAFDNGLLDESSKH
jgi:two-component system, NarL family, nitrate/nitrite response regulator NarL